MANNFPNLRPSFNADFVNGIYVDPRITFTRAGTRTYFGREMVKAEENLFTGSNSLNTGWSVLDATNVTGQTDPFAGTTAISLVGNGVLGRPRQVRAITSTAAGTVMTTSVFAKAGTESFLQILYAGNSRFINCNLTTGAFAVEGGASGTAVDVGGGWWRFSHTFVATSATDVQIAIISGIGDARATSITTSGNILLYGAQLEQRSFATAYTATTTQPITRYQRLLKTAAANEWPREFDPVTGECLGRSVWESRTNLLLRSEEFSDAYWTKSNSAVTANQIIAPDGTLTADKLVTNNAVGSGHIQRSITVSAGAHTLSMIAKAGEWSWVRVGWGGGGTSFNLASGAVGTVGASDTASIVSLGNGWYRCIITRTLTASTDTYRVYSTNADNAFTTGDGTSGIYIWGAQLEAGAFATPYIPTVASQITRLADSAVMTGTNFSSWFNPEQHSVFIEANSVAGGAFRSAVRITDSGATNFHEIGMVTGSNNGVGRFQANYANAGQWDTGNISSPAFVANTYYKLCGSFQTNNFIGVRDGGAAATDTTGNVALGVDRLEIGSRQASGIGNFLNGYIKRLTYYPQALTSANLQAITR